MTYIYIVVRTISWFNVDIPLLIFTYKSIYFITKVQSFLLGFIMYRGKGIASESSAVIREHKKWTTDMDFRLLNCMIDETSMGNRIDGSWTTQGYTNIVKSLHQSGLVGITKNM